MKKLFIGTLSLLLLFTSAEHGALVNALAEEPDPIETEPGESELTEEIPETVEEKAELGSEPKAAENTEEPEEEAKEEKEEAASETEEDRSSAAMDDDKKSYTVTYLFDTNQFKTDYIYWEVDGKRYDENEYSFPDGAFYLGGNYTCPSIEPKSPGLVFKGWGHTKDGEAEFEPGKSYPALAEAEGSSVALYAIWESAGAYTLRIEPNGGEIHDEDFIDTITYDYLVDSDNYSPESVHDYLYEIFDCSYLRKKGYDFAGFYFDPEFRNPCIIRMEIGGRERWTDTVDIRREPGNYTLYVKWEVNNYRVEYEFNHGQPVQGNPEKYYIDQTVTLKNPTRRGYTFLGWHFDESLNDDPFTTLSIDVLRKYFDEDDLEYMSEFTLYAEWIDEKDDSYTIRYDFSSDKYLVSQAQWDVIGTDAISENFFYDIEDREYGTGKKYKCPSAKPAAPGLTFQGWSRTKDGPVEFKPGATYSSLGESKGVCAVLYAVWKPSVYTLKIELNGGSVRENYSNIIKYDFYKGPEDSYYSTNGNIQADRLVDYIENYEFYKFGYSCLYLYQDKEFTQPYYPYSIMRDRFEFNPGNKTLYVKWKPNTFSLDYELNGGELEKNNPKEFTAGESIKLNNPTKEGYTFGGWYATYNFTKGKIVTLDIDSLKNSVADPEDYDDWRPSVTLYAKWIEADDTFKLAYNLNGGKGKLESTVENLNDVEITLKIPPKRAGYSFDGWTLVKNGEQRLNDDVTPEDLHAKKNKTVTVYAKWKANNYHIDYVLDDGINNPDNLDKYNADGKNVTLKDPTWEGHVFEGWFDNEYFLGKKITSIKKDAAKDYVLYAKWSPAQYTLAYNANGQKISLPGKAKHALLEDVELARVPEIAGYDFLGWNTKKNGTGIQLESDQEFAVGYDLGAKKGSTVTLYAQWKAEEYNIAYELNGGTDPGNPVSYKSDKGASLKKPKKDGYKFVGWYGDEHFTGTKISKINKGTAGDLKLYALWADKNNKNTFKIAYNLNGLKGSLETTTAGLGEGDYVFLKYPPERKGYEFVCWKDVTGENYYYPNEMIMNPANEFGGEKGKTVTLIAEWKQKCYDVRFYANAENAFFTDRQISDNYMREMLYYNESQYIPGSNWEVTTGNGMLKMFHTYDRPVSISVAPVRPGYKLAGWSRDPKATKAEYLLGKKYANFNPDGKDYVELYAVWK